MKENRRNKQLKQTQPDKLINKLTMKINGKKQTNNKFITNRKTNEIK